jgi:integrase
MATVRKRTWETDGEAKAAWQVDYTDSRGKRRREHFPTKKSADAFRIHVEGQMQLGTYRPDADKVTVGDVCEGFLEHCAGRSQRDERMTRKMLVVYKGHVKNYILHPECGLGSRKLSQLTARSVHDFRDRLRSAGVTVPTARKILATLHSALEYAISQDWVATNAARGVRVIGPRDEGSERVTPPSKEAVRALLDAADEDTRLMVQFAVATGARAGEQWAIRWRDLDLDNGRLNISRRVDAYRDEGAPKSAAGVRTVPIAATLVASLKAWK